MFYFSYSRFGDDDKVKYTYSHSQHKSNGCVEGNWENLFVKNIKEVTERTNHILDTH